MFICHSCASPFNDVLSRCACLHFYCDECAVVAKEGENPQCEFCPLCEIECEIRNVNIAILASQPVDTVQPPPEFICPITRDIMADPVILADGNTYEREAIARWLQLNQSSPVTREPIPSIALIPNRAMKHMIDAWKQANRPS